MYHPTTRVLAVLELLQTHGRMSGADVYELEGVACPGAGACGGQFTANTMAMAFEVLGISPSGFSMVPAVSPHKAEVAEQAGALAMDILKRGLRPSEIITRRSLENAIAAIACSGGSTNGVLHLLAIAKEMGIELDIDDFDEISERTPLLCDLKPGGQYVTPDLYEAGGVAAMSVLTEPEYKNLLVVENPATSPSPGRRSARSPTPPSSAPARRSCDRSRTRSRRPAGWPSCTGTSRPTAVSSSSPATSGAPRRVRHGSSSPRRRRWRPSPSGRSTPAT